MRSFFLLIAAFTFNSAKSQDRNLFDLQKHLQKNKIDQDLQMQKDVAKNNLKDCRSFLGSWKNLSYSQNEPPKTMGLIPNIKVQQPTLGIIPNVKANPATSGVIPNAAIPKRIISVW